jgi:hypothetical protein
MLKRRRALTNIRGGKTGNSNPHPRRKHQLYLHRYWSTAAAGHIILEKATRL